MWYSKHIGDTNDRESKEMNNTSNPEAKDVNQIMFRQDGQDVEIPVHNLSREEAIRVYETIAENERVTFACAFVQGGSRI